MVRSAADRLADRLRSHGDLKLVPYIVGGHPDMPRSIELGRRLARSGIAALEVGIPYSDPLADGPIIQRAAYRSLASGTSVKDCLEIAAQISAVGQAPPVLMTYINPVLAYGPARFARDAASAGAAGVIFPDLPVEEAEEFTRPLDELGLACVFLVAPTSSEERVSAIARKSSGFVYCVTIAGITGPRAELPAGLSQLIDRVRRHSTLPVAAGFGVSTPDHLRQLRGMADAAVVGSAVVADIEAGHDPVALVEELLAACA